MSKNTPFIPTEPIGSIPRPKYLIDAIQQFQKGNLMQRELDAAYDKALQETVLDFEATDSPVITDGEQTKSSFATYPLNGMRNLNPEGFVISFKDGHTRQLPILTKGPFQYQCYASQFLKRLKHLTKRSTKQAVISPSALSLIYPSQGLDGYTKEEFLSDLIECAVRDIRECLNENAIVQIDFTEARLAVKLDPSKGILKSFIELNNKVLSHFNASERKRLGVHTCPGGDKDSTHSADVPYKNFLPELFQLDVNNFYIQLRSEKNPEEVLQVVKPFIKNERRLFIGVTDPLTSRVETAEEVSDLILKASKIIPVDRLGSTDDCGFSPFCDDTSTSRETAFAKIRNRVVGTAKASTTLSSTGRTVRAA